MAVVLNAPAVPEPSTYAMATLGLISLGFYRWRRKRAPPHLLLFAQKGDVMFK